MKLKNQIFSMIVLMTSIHWSCHNTKKTEKVKMVDYLNESKVDFNQRMELSLIHI